MVIGSKLGPYEILAPLGAGGMGEVYRARDPRLGRDVAIKVLPVAAAADEDPSAGSGSPRATSRGDRRARFEREARAVAALNHPNIVTIHAVEEADGVPFFTMEYIEGRTLRDLIPAHGLPLDELLKIAIPLTDAVSAAHQRGILHRDLKPANVMVTSDGRVKVLDFGLAKLKEALLGATEGMQATTEATGEGRILGTAAYMSPEQAEGRPLDARSDVFSLGVVLYEMATGQRPFKGDTNVSVISSILKDTPGSVTELRPELPRDLGKIVRHALSKDPEHRYQTAKDLRNDLEALKADLDSGELQAAGAGPGPRSRRRWPRWAWAVTALVVVALAAVGIFGPHYFKAPPAAPPAPPFGNIAMTRLTADGKAGGAVAISPDGRYVAHAFVDQGRQGLRVRQVETSAAVQVVAPADVDIDGLAFTPDGSRLCYSTYARGSGIASLFDVPVLGGTPRKLLENIDSQVTFVPDGKRFAFIRGFPARSALMVANPDGTGEQTLVERKAPVEFALASPAWSPDGAAIVAAAYDESTQREVLLAVDPASGAARPLGSSTWNSISALAWIPGSPALLVAANDFRASEQPQLWLVEYPGGATRRVTNDLAGYARLGVSADGRTIVATRADSRGSVWVGLAGQPDRAGRIASVPDTVSALWIGWSRDGRILYSASSGGDYDMWSARPDGSDLRQLTATPGRDGLADATRDGQHVVFVSERDGLLRIWRMDADGGRQTALTAGPLDLWPVVSADSKSVYYVRFSEPLSPLYRLPVDGGQPIPVSPPAGSAEKGHPAAVPQGFHPHALSPDGTRLLGGYWDDAQGRSRLAVVDAAGLGAPRLFDVPVSNAYRPLAWMPDGRAFSFVKAVDGVDNLWRQPVDGGAPTRLTNFTGDDFISAHAWSPDGKLLAMVRTSTSRDVVIIRDQRR